MSTDTTLKWKGLPSAASYLVRWRRTDASNWTEERRSASCEQLALGIVDPAGRVTGLPSECTLVLRGIRVDDWVFGVSSVSAEGFESPVAAAVPGGAFVPYAPPAATE